MASTRSGVGGDERQAVAQAPRLEQLEHRLGRVVGELDGARHVRGHGHSRHARLMTFGVCLMASGSVQRRPGDPGYPRPMDTHDTKSFPSDAMPARANAATAPR